jgi:hypothetical protein
LQIIFNISIYQNGETYRQSGRADDTKEKNEE